MDLEQEAAALRSRPLRMDSIRDDSPRVSRPVLSYRQPAGITRRQPKLTLRRRFSNSSEVSVASNEPNVGSLAGSQLGPLPPRVALRRGRVSRPPTSAQLSVDPSLASRSRSVPPASDLYGTIPTTRHEEAPRRTPVTAPRPPDPRAIFSSRYDATSSMGRTSTDPRTNFTARTLSDPRTSSTRTFADPRTVTFESETEDTASCLSTSTLATSVDSKCDFDHFEPQDKVPRHVRAVPVGRRTARTGVRVQSSRRSLHMDVLAAQAQLQDIQSQQRAEAMETLRSESQALVKQHASMTKELDDAKSELSTLRSEKESTAKVLETEKTQLETLRKEIAEQSAMLDELRRSFDAKDLALTGAQTERDLFRDAKEAFEERCNDLEKELKAVRGGQNDLEATLIAQVAHLEITKDTLQSKVGALEESIQEKEKAVGELAAEKTQLTANVEKRDEQIVALAGDKKALEVEKEALQLRLEGLAGENGELKGKLEVVVGENGELKSKLEAVVGEKKEVQEKLDTTEEEKTEIQTRLEAEKKDLETRIENLEAEKGEQEAKVTEGEEKLNDIAAARDGLQEELASLKEKSATLEADVGKLQEDLQAATTKAGALEEDNESPAPQAEAETTTSENPDEDSTPATETTETSPPAEPAPPSDPATSTIIADLEQKNKELEDTNAKAQEQLAALRAEADRAAALEAEKAAEADRAAALEAEKAAAESRAAAAEEEARHIPLLRTENADLSAQLGGAHQRVEQLGAANAGLRAHLDRLQQHQQRPPRPTASTVAGSDAGSVASSKRTSKSGSGKPRAKDDLVVVRTPGDRGQFQVMRKSEFYRSRSPSRSRSDSD